MEYPDINKIATSNTVYRTFPSAFSPLMEIPPKSNTHLLSNICPFIPIKPIKRRKTPLSPPISPEVKGASPRDASIFMSEYSLDLTEPSVKVDKSDMASLFLSRNEIPRLSDHHAELQMASDFQVLSPPHTRDYKVVLEFKSQIGKAFNANRRKWARRELAQLKEDNRRKSEGRCRQKYTITQLSSGKRTNVKKTPKDRLAIASSKVIAVKVNKTARVRKSNRRGEMAEGSKRIAREDKNFAALPDHCPPLSSLPNKVNSLKVDWKGVPIDLRSDSFAHLLHHDEIQLAANLRLDCATYLTSKRRIFISRRAAYKIGKEFRKTDAQQACKIDVNKASKLWQAFDKVGWLHEKWVPD